ncbi:unnamed protein product [Aphanomyces euteiches]
MDYDYDSYPVKSGAGIWIDVDTPQTAQQKVSSRGESWDLVMSDEFEIDGRSFVAGKDHLWTALDLADGVNSAMEMYNSSNVYTKNGKLVNKIEDKETNVTYFNQWLDVPGYQTRTMNKFCMQGGLIEVAAKLPGAINNVTDDEHKSITTNPNALGYQWVNGQKVALAPLTPVIDSAYYPTWPGIWLMGNLGRALFSASTTRMWPWTYAECDADLDTNQTISACNATPGYGMNAYQGRGAPEIDILEGGGAAISSSIQVAPGMPDEYRRIPVVAGGADTDAESQYTNSYCIYSKTCNTLGANIPDLQRSWYQGLRYAANNQCPANHEQAQGEQGYLSVKAAQDKGVVTANVYDWQQMSASRDVHVDLSLINSSTTLHWGINYEGRCFPIVNTYVGAFLCDPVATNSKCASPRKPGVAPTNQMAKYEYQMDAISVDWDINHDAYTTFYVYQVEWVTGANGYVRWSLFDSPLFEVPATALTTPPQAADGSGKIRNPKKIMIEEPMYFIFNVALSTAWGAMPPNTDIGPCRGNATNPVPGSADYNKSNNICDSFPMYMEIDYIRVYQNKSSMFLGCDPPTHPTKKWIAGHSGWYTDSSNPMTRVDGGATCNSDDDCLAASALEASGRCYQRRCACVRGYGGPRCTKFIGSESSSLDDPDYYGPELVYPATLTSAVVALLVLSSFIRRKRMAAAVVLAETTKSRSTKEMDEEDAAAAAAHRRFYAPVSVASN